MTLATKKIKEWPTLEAEDVERVLEFFKIDKEWFEHLLARNFNCVCNTDYSTSCYCPEYERVRDVLGAERNLERCRARLEEYLDREAMDEEYPVRFTDKGPITP
jgi:hypothetical protein